MTVSSNPIINIIYNHKDDEDDIIKGKQDNNISHSNITIDNDQVFDDQELLDESDSTINTSFQLNKDEFILLLKWTWPILVSNLLFSVAYIFINLVFVGHIGKNEFAAVALGNTWQFATSALSIGTLNAMDTLISQSFGAKQFKLIGLTVQRAIIVSIVFNTLLSILWCFTGNILILIRQDPEIAMITQSYTIYMIPGLWFGCGLTILQKYLQTQGIMIPCILIGILFNLLNIVLNYLFINIMGFGVIGSSMATSIAKTFGFFGLLGWIYHFKLHQSPIQTWFGFDKETFSLDGLKQYLSIGVPSGLQLVFEGWGFEILTLMAGLLNPVSLDAHSITMNFNLLNFMLPFSLSIAVSIRIGQLLGAKKVETIKKSLRVAFIITTIIILISSTFQYTTRNIIGKLYSKDKEVIHLVSGLIPLSALSKLFDGYQTTCQGIVRGVGKNSLGAILNFGSFYLIGLPLSAAFTFSHMIPLLYHTVYGLWWGLNIGLFNRLE
ncbi:multi antimicrobial extrusion family protein [Cavenderia fasciculata]|uniref:Multi antimicrobial extrusion family protein n=1 Tax=Cavenderia fasciculata TaxID=261658 RepID=F4PPB8_CACFS|nr:multi antimicrobial extrusion family protein [Cavenderia fasciculata]EGG22231.1 multi antimicrobial extrusion family protein [Cavenderia fasciculata]|eukprot:XP_004360082.1 multi antimicrobial extrusion family protein [Cavenderia fasciculata]